MTQRKILAVLAHPDDETLGFGGTLARYADKGVETHLICATRGQRGWVGASEDYPGVTELGLIREQELMNATKILNLKSVQLLDYMDGDLDQADPQTIINQIAQQIRQIRPQVVLTFDPNGAYGHPDHIAISQFTTAAIVRAAYRADGDVLPAHQVEALYYRVGTQLELESYQSVFGELVMMIDGVERRATSYQEWAITTRIDTSAYVSNVWQAAGCHQSQLVGYAGLMTLPEKEQQAIFGTEAYYRAFSFVFGGRKRETEFFH